ncbi:alanine racemase [Natronorubrum sp. FCH18a]|uniref:alanine racemase n=1 Tax=Natronorubrum sp. FCH18a TaxID=3447018 RepID=UPI003F519B54
MPLPSFAEMQPTLGKSVDELETPIVIGDLDVLERNLETFQSLAERSGVSVRSHTKAHKIPEIARLQEEYLDHGVLCQKLSEAEIMARNGIKDILLVCPVVSETKLDRLLWVADHTEHFATMIECRGNIEPLQSAAAARDVTINVVLEMEVGLDRMGVEPGEPALEVAEFIDAQPNLSLEGVLGHDAQVSIDADTEEEYFAGCQGVADDLSLTVDLLEAAGIEVETVTSGCSATARFMAKQDVITELDPGRYVFNDATLLESRVDIGKEDCGATVLTTVISRPTDDRAIVDAGSKTISYAEWTNPVPKSRDDLTFERKWSEHGMVDVSETGEEVEVGDRLEFIVPTLYGAVNLQDTIPGVREGRVEEVWQVEARGKDK